MADRRGNGRTRRSGVGVERIPGRVVGRIVARAVPDHLRPGSPGSEGNEDGGSEDEKRGLAHVGIIAADARRGDGTAARTAADKRQDGISRPDAHATLTAAGSRPADGCCGSKTARAATDGAVVTGGWFRIGCAGSCLVGLLAAHLGVDRYPPPSRRIRHRGVRNW